MTSSQSSGIGAAVSHQMSFGELLKWHLLEGTRPPDSTEKGKAWSYKTFASKCGVSDRQVRNWIANRNKPEEVETIERILFGSDQDSYFVERREIRWAHASFGSKVAVSRPVIHCNTIINIPHKLPIHFIGRDSLMDIVDQIFSAAPSETCAVALHGMQGIGKSSLALEIALSTLNSYQIVWWLNAETITSIEDGLLSLGRRLKWTTRNQARLQQVDHVISKLEDFTGAILLIYDNAMCTMPLTKRIPKRGRANIIITSIQHAWRFIATPLEVTHWPKTTGGEFLLLRSGQAKGRKSAESLSEELAGLPLAHEQAAAYCERLQVPIETYLKRFLQNRKPLMDDKRHAPLSYYEGRTVWATFSMSIDAATKEDPTANFVLFCISKLSAEPVPVELLLKIVEHNNVFRDIDFTPERLDECLAVFSGFALVQRSSVKDFYTTGDIITCHRLVREIALLRGDGAEGGFGDLNFIQPILEAYPDNPFHSSDTWLQCQLLKPHVSEVISNGHNESFEEHLGIAEILNKVASFEHSALGDLEAAEELFRKALQIRKDELSTTDERIADIMNNLGLLLQERGKHKEAISFIRKSLSYHTSVSGEIHRETAICLNNLALVLQDKGRFKLAHSYFERAYNTRVTLFGEEHAACAQSMNNLATNFMNLECPDEAERWHKRSIKVRQNLFGKDHPDLAQSFHNLGTLKMRYGSGEEALELFETALRIWETHLADEHPLTNRCRRNLAEALLRFTSAKDSLVRALNLAQKALSNNRTMLGEQHHWTIDTLATLDRITEKMSNECGQ